MSVLNTSVALLMTMCSFVCASELELRIEAPPAESSSRIFVEISFENSGDSDIVLYAFRGQVQYAMGGILHFDIVNEAGDTLVYDRVVGITPKYPHKGDTLILKTGQQYKELVNLTPFYSLPGDSLSEYDEEGANGFGMRQWSPGRYAIQARYHYEHRWSFIGGRDLWRGSATSNAIDIVIP